MFKSLNILRWLVLATLLVTSVIAGAQERINNFDVAIDVQKNGDFIVTETITVTAELRAIKRGIFRELPRYLSDETSGAKIPNAFEVVSVRRDGKREPFSVSKNGNAVRVRIGNPDVILNPGEHIYTLTYIAPAQIRRFEKADEVYWNVTGNYWDFPIERAEAAIIFPYGATITDISAYSGAYGATGQSASGRIEGRTATFKMVDSLAPGEGLTVSASVAKGVIAPVSESQKRGLWWLQNGTASLLSGLMALISGFYLWAWNKAGRDPSKPAVIPRYRPPEGYSAAACSYIFYRGISANRALVATLMGLANKGAIEIDIDKKCMCMMVKVLDLKITFHADERDLKALIFPGQVDTVNLDGKPNSKFHKAYGKFKKRLGKLYGRPYYIPNSGYFVAGIALSIAAAIAIMVFSPTGLNRVTGFLLAGLVAINLIFPFFLPAPTKKGQAIRTHIEGFKLYMKTAEKERLNAVDITDEREPFMTKDRYEALLPFAVALDVEKPWSRYFEKVLPDEAKRYRATGIHGANASSLSKATKSMVSSISSGVASAAPQSSSSSGSGGGGFSGGGGGGGGGGGW